MTHIAFFGHDSGDAAVKRRVQNFRDDGMTVTGFMMRRNDGPPPAWENVDLGRTADAAYVQRVKSIFSGARIAATEAEKLKAADLIYARNLDMLALAFEAKRQLRLDTRVVYECLDVHRLLSRRDPLGMSLRTIESALLRRCAGVVVSSPGFLTNHFERYYRGQYKAFLLENRMAAGADYGPRPSADTAPAVAAPIAAPIPANDAGTARPPPLRLGWIGILRCARSLDLLLTTARELGPDIEIHLHGKPAETEIPDFHEKVKQAPNLTFHGRYSAPEDLSKIYGGLDLVWAGDFMEAGQNSVWLLPNRLYEGGYYGVPAIAPTGTQTSKWIEARKVGFSLEENLETTLPDFLRRISADRGKIARRRASLLALPESDFIQPPGALREVIEACLGAEADQPREVA
ncbi:MAG: hypothetical protein R3C52_02090 [Hyphomonadaceae bacterium]